ncbi:MAG TPA: peptidase M23, partial [Cyanothece sp. UBA12306]|nr:peptidase M23 [Cyanothece sp. UBA12306]
MQKVKSMSSCPSVSSLAEVSPGTLNTDDGYCRVRRSAAMIGLAISMSATGLLLTQNKAAVAANSLTANVELPSLPTSSNTELAKSDGIESDGSQLAPLALKHKVKVGESIEQLARDYQIDPDEIAAINKISLESDLVAGQTLKIPSLDQSVAKNQSQSSKIEAPQSKKLAVKPLNTSLDHLRETRKRLQDSLVELKSEKSKPKSDITPLVADVSDVSQPLKPVEVQSQFNQDTHAQAISLPVMAPENDSVSLKKPNQSSDSTSSVISPLSKVEISDIKPVITRRNTATKVPSLAKLPSVPEAKVEESTLPQFKEPVVIQVPNPESNNSATQPQIPAYSSNIQPSKSPQPMEMAPQTTVPTKQARIVPQPRLNSSVSNRSYKVKPGDTLNSIARSHGLTLSELIRANGINNANLIKVHQTLIIPQKNGGVPLKPETIANIPQSGNLVATSERLSSSYPALPVPLSALSSRSKVENNSVKKGSPNQNQGQPIEISVKPDSSSYTDQLKADIANMEQEYAANLEPDAIEIKPNYQNNSKKPVVGQTLNNEWAKDRKNTSQSQSIAQRLPNSRLVGVAPSDTEQYNDAFRIPVGTNVGPELPPLSGPDKYLPNAPMQFTGYIWPAKGVLTSGYGRRWGRMHKGIDIAAPIGTPIIASAPGEVITAEWNSGGYGKLVKVRHPDGSVTLYAHNSRLLVRRGQKVEQGQQIAEMGSTGYSTGPH